MFPLVLKKWVHDFNLYLRFLQVASRLEKQDHTNVAKFSYEFYDVWLFSTFSKNNHYFTERIKLEIVRIIVSKLY